MLVWNCPGGTFFATPIRQQLKGCDNDGIDQAPIAGRRAMEFPIGRRSTRCGVLDNERFSHRGRPPLPRDRHFTRDERGGSRGSHCHRRTFRSTIQNTPVSVSALTGDQSERGRPHASPGYRARSPGPVHAYAGPGFTEYEARGLASNGGAAPTVGFYLDEIPLSPPALSQSGKVVIDPNLYDIERVEILRGPQGTLYGSGSMGGTVKVLTNQPKLGTFEGSVARYRCLGHRRRRRQLRRQSHDECAVGRSVLPCASS